MTESSGLDTRARPAAETLWFCGLACALLAFLFRDAWLHGYVLGQADFLFDYLPWQSYRPDGLRVRNPLMGDPPMVFYPFIFHARAQILSGHFPVWASALGGGQPFFGAMQTAVLSPFTLFDYALPFPASLTVDAAARLLCGGVGMYAFLRRLPLCREAALFGGIAYLLNPFSIVWLEHPLSAVAAWLPWMLLAVDRCVREPVGRSIAALAVVTALMLFTGHPETAFKVLLLAGPYAIYRGWSAGRPVRTVSLVVSAMALGALLTSIQLVPFLEYARGSRVLETRAAAGVPLFTTPIVSFVTAFVPDFFGTPLRHKFVIGGNYCEQQIYAGLLTWLLAAVALTHRQLRGRALFFLGMGVVAVLIMYGTPVARAALLLIPPLRVAALSRFGLLAIAGLCVAGAIGVDALLQEDTPPAAPRRSRHALVGTIAAAAIAAIVVVFLVSQRPLLASTRQWADTLRSTIAAAAFLAAGVAVLHVAPRVRRGTAVGLLVGLLAVDLLSFAEGFHPLLPRQDAFPPTRETSLLQADPGLFRVVGWIDTLLPNTALVYGLRDVRSYDGIGVREYFDLLDVGFRFTGAMHQLVNMAHPHLLDLLNVKYVLVPPGVELPADRFQLVLDGPTRIYRNERVQPRAFLTDAQVTLSGNPARRAMRDTLDLTRVAVLDAPLADRLQPERATGEVGQATVRKYADDGIAIVTRADGRRLLVVTDVYYPGWTATIDGAPAAILRADYAFRAVSVPAGEHLVEFRYRPASIRYGAIGSLAGLVALALLVAGSQSPVASLQLPVSSLQSPVASLQSPVASGFSRTSNAPVLSLVIPVPRREADVAPAIGELRREVDRLGVTAELIVAGRDLSHLAAEIAAAGARTIGAARSGFGPALRAGLEAATGDYVLTVDAACGDAAEAARDLWNSRGDAEVIVASRYVPGARARMSAPRRIASRAVNAAFGRGLSLPVTDLSSAFRLYRREVLRDQRLEGDDYDVLPESLVRALAGGWTVGEIPLRIDLARRDRSLGPLLRLGASYVRTFGSLWRLRNSIQAGDYDARAHDSVIPLQRYWQRQRFRHVTALVAGEGPVLDVGCGSSRIIGALPRGSVALDILPNKLRYSRRYGTPLVRGSAFALPFADRSFPCVLSSQVIEHVPMDSPILSELDRTLAPGGRLVLGTPDYDRWEWVYTEKAYGFFKPGGYADEHIAHYTRAGLIAHFTRLGYTHEATRYILRGELILAFRKSR